MIQIYEAIGIALASIWANKLRSFMMVLGNIVAVMSIIAVVSLIQGMNSYVGEVIMSEVGAGTFRIDRIGVVTDEDAHDQAQRRPVAECDAHIPGLALWLPEPGLVGFWL